MRESLSFIYINKEHLSIRTNHCKEFFLLGFVLNMNDGYNKAFSKRNSYIGFLQEYASRGCLRNF